MTGKNNPASDTQGAVCNTDFIINGRFLLRPPSGVDRVAEELARALASIAQDNQVGNRKVTFVIPKNAAIHPQSGLAAVLENEAEKFQLRRIGFFRGHLWEQIFLSRYRRKSWLLNLCNTGPVARRRQLTLVHDAQVYLMPDTYSYVFRTVYRHLLPRLGRLSNVFATVSDFSKTQLEKAGVAPLGKTIVLPNGSDHMDRIEPAADTLERFKLTRQGYILAIGSLAPHKNLKFLTRAAAARQKTGGRPLPPLVIAGGGNSAIFANAGINEDRDVRVLGRVSDADLKSLYTHAVALAFPSFTEGFGLPPVEAMRCGTPVIASTGGAIPEVCRDAAILIDPENMAEWTKALNQITNDETLRKSLIKKGRRRAEELNWMSTARHLISAINKYETRDRNNQGVSPIGSRLRSIK